MNNIYVNWNDKDVLQNWDFVGAAVVYHMESKKPQECPHGNQNLRYCDECDCYPDTKENNNFPAMNYAYPLSSEPDKDKIIRVCEETCCTVVRNLQEDKYYLALTGNGMDLSQDIALAYIIADSSIPWSLLEHVYNSGAFSVSEKDYKIILKELERQLTISINKRKAKLKELIK